MIEQAVLIGLAAWRMASLFSQEDGPLSIFARFRTLIGVPETGEITGVLPLLFTCMACLTMWMAAAMWGLWELEPIAVMVIAAMSVALTVERWMANG